MEENLWTDVYLQNIVNGSIDQKINNEKMSTIFEGTLFLP